MSILIPSNQSGFKLGDFLINQLLSITHVIYELFDDGIEARSVFNSMYQENLIKSSMIVSSLVYGISLHLLNLSFDFSKKIKQ